MGHGQIFGQTKLVVRRHNVQHVVRDGRSFGCGRLCRSDVHTGVDRHGIQRNDFSTQTLRKPNTDACLSAGGGSREIPAINNGRELVNHGNGLEDYGLLKSFTLVDD